MAGQPLSGLEPAQQGSDAEADIRWSARLLWSACHRHPVAETVKEAIDAGADVPLVVSAAIRHRVAALLWRGLEAAGSLDELGGLRPRLSELAEVQRMREQLLVPQALERAILPLTNAGFEPVVLKGPALSSRYPAAGLRPFDDIDLLLTKKVHARAVRVLRRAGWELTRPPARDRYDSVLVHPELPELSLELHYGLDAWYDRASSLRADELWERRVPLELSGVSAFGLPLTEELVMLCAHAAKPYHGFSRLIWVVDLAMILGDVADRGGEADWEHVAALARKAKCSTAVAVALGLARFAGAQVPSGVGALPTRGWRAAALARLVDEEWPLMPGTPIHLRFALAEGTGRRFMLLVGYTHGMPGLRAALWYARNLDQAVRRWRDLHGRDSTA